MVPSHGFFEPPEPRFFAKNTEGFSFGRVRKMFSGRSSATYKRKIQRQQTIFYNTQVTSWSNPRSSAFPENVVDGRCFPHAALNHWQPSIPVRQKKKSQHC
jgi:hypothetical protein